MKELSAFFLSSRPPFWESSARYCCFPNRVCCCALWLSHSPVLQRPAVETGHWLYLYIPTAEQCGERKRPSFRFFRAWWTTIVSLPSRPRQLFILTNTLFPSKICIWCAFYWRPFLYNCTLLMEHWLMKVFMLQLPTTSSNSSGTYCLKHSLDIDVLPWIAEIVIAFLTSERLQISVCEVWAFTGEW